MSGVLNYVFNFFYEWLFGSAPVTYLNPYADLIAFAFSLVMVCVVVWFAFKLVTGLVKLIYYMIE